MVKICYVLWPDEVPLHPTASTFLSSTEIQYLVKIKNEKKKIWSVARINFILFSWSVKAFWLRFLQWQSDRCIQELNWSSNEKKANYWYRKRFSIHFSFLFFPILLFLWVLLQSLSIIFKWVFLKVISSLYLKSRWAAAEFTNRVRLTTCFWGSICAHEHLVIILSLKCYNW